VRRQVPDERFPGGRPMIDIATEILQSLQARNGKRIGMEVLLAFGDDPQTSRAVAEFVVRSLLSYSRP
jgi:hypothetical protein